MGGIFAIMGGIFPIMEGISLYLGWYFLRKTSQNSRDVLFLKKKAPARQPRVVVGIGFHRKSQFQRILTKRIPFSEKVREAK